jgi:hypothetical protein
MISMINKLLKESFHWNTVRTDGDLVIPTMSVTYSASANSVISMQGVSCSCWVISEVTKHHAIDALRDSRNHTTHSCFGPTSNGTALPCHTTWMIYQEEDLSIKVFFSYFANHPESGLWMCCPLPPASSMKSRDHVLTWATSEFWAPFWAIQFS